MMMAVSFSLGYAAADWRGGQVVKEVRAASRTSAPVALERKASKATVPIFPAAGGSRLVKNNGKTEEDIKIRASFYKALVEKESPKKEKMSPLRLKTASRQPAPVRESADKAVPAGKAVKDSRVRPRSVEAGHTGSRRGEPVKVSPPVGTARPVQIEGTLGKFTIQVISVQKPSRAIRITRNLQDAGFSAFLQRIVLNGRGTWYRIRVGRFPNRQSAQKILRNLRLKALARSGSIVPL